MFQSVDEADSGIAYPACVPRVNVCNPLPVLVIIVRSSPPDVEVAIV